MAERINLAQLKGLNPDAIEFEVPAPTTGDSARIAGWKERYGDKVLVLKELAHPEWFAVQAKVADLQTMITPGTIPDIKKLETASFDCLLDFYRPHNDWVTREFFEPLSERYLNYLLEKAIALNSAFATEALEKAGLVPQTPAPQNRATRRRESRSTGTPSTKT